MKNPWFLKLILRILFWPWFIIIIKICLRICHFLKLNDLYSKIFRKHFFSFYCSYSKLWKFNSQDGSLISLSQKKKKNLHLSCQEKKFRNKIFTRIQSIPAILTFFFKYSLTYTPVPLSSVTYVKMRCKDLAREQKNTILLLLFQPHNQGSIKIHFI